MSKTIKDDFDKTNDDPPAKDEPNTFDEYWVHKKQEWATDAEGEEQDPDRDYDVSI